MPGPAEGRWDPGPTEGSAARLVLERLLLEEPMDTEGLVAAAGACRAPGGGCTARPGPAAPRAGR